MKKLNLWFDWCSVYREFCEIEFPNLEDFELVLDVELEDVEDLNRLFACLKKSIKLKRLALPDISNLKELKIN